MFYINIAIVVVVAIVLIILVSRYYKNEEFTRVDNDTEHTQIIENYPTAPQNVLTSDASGNLSVTSDLGLQNLSVNGDIGIGPSGKFKFNPGTDNWVRLFNNANKYDDYGFGATRLWTQNIHGKPVFVDGVAGNLNTGDHWKLIK